MEATGERATRDVLLRVVTLTVGASLLLGLAAAILGGPLEQLGAGFGGLGGTPGILLTLCAVTGPIVAWRRPAPRPWLAVGLWPLVVFVSYNLIAHWLDPCGFGLLDGASRIGTQPLCESFGRELNVHTRFHLLLHAATAAIAVLAARRLWPAWRAWPVRGVRAR